MDFKHLIFGALLLSLTQMGVEIPMPHGTGIQLATVG